MHNTTFTDSAKRRKEQKFPHQRATSLGDMTLTFEFAGTDLKEVEPGKFFNLGKYAELIEISYLSNKTCRGDLSYTLHGKDILAVWNLFKIVTDTNGAKLSHFSTIF